MAKHPIKNAKMAPFNSNLMSRVRLAPKVRVPKLKKRLLEALNFNGDGLPDILIRLYMVVDWCTDRTEYTAKIKVIPKKDYPVLMPCEF